MRGASILRVLHTLNWLGLVSPGGFNVGHRAGMAAYSYPG